MSIHLNAGHTYVLAEAGVNHDGDVARAKELIAFARDAGADGVKFQYFRPEEIASPLSRKAEYQAKNEGATHGEETQQDMLQRLTLTEQEYRSLKEETERLGMDFITTPFDIASAQFLASIGVKALKIPSGEVTNLPYLAQVADLGIFTIISTGMCNLQEIREATALFDERKTPYILLHCVSSYPAPDDQINLRAMETMRATFGVPVGYSDHTTGIEASLAAVAIGASFIEKHFTYDKTASGPDHAASLEPHELKIMIDGIRLIERELTAPDVHGLRDEELLDRVFAEEPLTSMADIATMKANLGTGEKACQPCEVDVLRMGRRSCQVVVPVTKGQAFTREMLAIRRPADDGLPPKMIDWIIGKSAARDIEANSLIRERDIA